ncbi:protein FAM114A2 [Caerostris extrusa]|uniref:Protein FAM114A2 n=1 Tax=Caerostris extrusa TaxID=172846 RepID=A0AAV4XZX6_CAEEX|nr:protein FAM114A2 [Caerostris extrusa]
MSESDSDLDFESADEDAEFASSPKNKTTIQKYAKECSGKVVAEEIEDNVNENDTSYEKTSETPKSVCKKIESDNNSGEKCDIKCVTEDASPLTKSDCTDFTQNNSNESASPNMPIEPKSLLQDSEERNISVSNSKKKTNSKELNVKQVIDSPIENPDQVDTTQSTHDEKSEASMDKQRVVLRLEKKMQQKKQLPKESPVEKEKPSDLINILHDLSDQQQSSWGFSSWGSSLLSTAASSVSTFSSQVTQGIGSVLDTVESTLGAPSPEDLATALSEKKAEAENSESKEKEKSSLLPDVSSWTKMIENTGSKVIMGGLDTLELIGKKTIDMLTEGDPGLRNKRAAFNTGSNLSELLREIKARADEQDKENSEDNVHYSQIFDEKQGLVHLEALEMLSKQSEAKFQRLIMRHSKNSDVKKRLEEVKSICENIPLLDDPSDCESFEDFEAVFKKYTLELSIPLNVENITKIQRQINRIINNYETPSEDTHSLPKSAIYSLAEFTAKCIETFHKVAELILVQPNLDMDLEHCATNLTGLTTVMCIEVNNLSSRYHKCLETAFEHFQKSGNNVDVNTLATNLYVEASNSNNYIQDAYQMLVPVLQVCLLEAIE